MNGRQQPPWPGFCPDEPQPDTDWRPSAAADAAERSGQPALLLPGPPALPEVRLPKPTVEPGRRTRHSEVALAELSRFAELVADGQQPAVAARTVGWPANRGLDTVRDSAAYRAVRQRVLAERAEAGVAPPQPFAEAKAIIEDNAWLAARVQTELLTTCTDPNVLARVSDSALDRPGLRAATKVDNTVRVELGEATLRNLAKLKAELPFVNAIDLERGPLGYALRQARPERLEPPAAAAGPFTQRARDRDAAIAEISVAEPES